jgi:hypothetical protein
VGRRVPIPPDGLVLFAEEPNQRLRLFPIYTASACSSSRKAVTPNIRARLRDTSARTERSLVANVVPQLSSELNKRASSSGRSLRDSRTPQMSSGSGWRVPSRYSCSPRAYGSHAR